MTGYPVLISIPHGGLEKPKEILDSLCITDLDLFDDIDPFVQEIYDVGNMVTKVIKADIARTFVDLNRSRDDLPPKNPDGLIKSMTCYKKPIYVKGREPNPSVISSLIANYYDTYHQKIHDSIDDSIKLGLDCHSMAAYAPSIAPDAAQQKRPLFCISNQHGKTCSEAMLQKFGSCIAQAFGISQNDISYNKPFAGGYITKTYGNSPVPWIQIEISRILYLEKPWFDRSTLSMDKSRLSELNTSFAKALELFFKN